MHWWAQLRSWARRGLQSTLATPADWLVSLFHGSRPTSTGVSVTPYSAVQSVAFYAAARNIAEDVGKLPRKIYKWLPEGGKEPSPNHSLYPILHDSPNPEQTAIEFWEWSTMHALIRGNSYAEIVRDGLGRVTALWPLHPDYVSVHRAPTGDLVYVVTLPSSLARQALLKSVTLQASQVLHLRGLSFDGVLGEGPSFVAREAIGLTLAVEEYGGRFFGNGANPGGIIKHPGILTPEAHKRVQETWNQAHQGLSMAHRVAILEGGMEWQQTGLQNEHAQFTQTRVHQIREMARLFRTPPHKIGDMERATFSNIEHQAIEYVVDTLLSWLTRIEQKLQMQLLSASEKRLYFIRHVVSGLLRGDITTRYAAYKIGREGGWLSVDEIREFEDMNPLPDGAGKTYAATAPASKAPSAGDTAPAETKPGDPSTGDSTPADVGLARMFVHDVAQRALRRELEAVRKAATRYAGDGTAWRAWVDEFYPRHAAYLAESLHITLDRARTYTTEHRAQLLADGATGAEPWETEALADILELAPSGVTHG